MSQALPLVLSDSVFFLPPPPPHIFAAYSESTVDYNYTSTQYVQKRKQCVGATEVLVPILLEEEMWIVLGSTDYLSGHNPPLCFG